MRSLEALLLILLVLVSATALASEPATSALSGFISLGGQADSTSGSVARFREMTEGERGGLFIERLELSGQGAVPFTLDSRFSAGNSGFANLSIGRGGWRGGVRVIRTRSWSGLSFADDVLPSGASVFALAPYTTELDPMFGEDEPFTDMTRAEAFVTRQFGTATSLTLRGGTRQREGVRVPNIGAFSPSDVGTSAFFAPGVEDIDSSSSFGSIEARTNVRRFSFRLDTGVSTRRNETEYALPAYGAAGLIDVNGWQSQTEADTTWIRASGTYARDSFSIEGAASRFETSAEATAGDFRTARDGLRLDRGDIDSTVSSGGVGTTLRVGARGVLALAVDVQSREGDGRGDLFLRSTAVDDVVTEVSSDRVGGTADFSARAGRTRFRVRGRMSTTETDVRENVSAYAQDITRNVGDFRADLSTRFSKAVRGRLWTRLGNEKTEVDIRQLDNGFTVGDADRSDVGGGLELSFGRGSRSTLLTVAAVRSDFENERPEFDPVFDPTQTFSIADGSVTTLRAATSTVWTFGEHSAWGEIGWQSSDYAFGEDYRQAGFNLLDEKVEGLVAALGTQFQPRPSLRVSGNVEWLRDREDLDRTLTRSSLELAQSIRNAEVFGRWTTGDLNAPRAISDEFTVNVFALGVRTRF